MKKYATTVIVFLCFFITGRAQEARLIVEVSTDTVLLGNYFELKFTVENIQGRFEAPNLSAFQVVGGPNSSTSISMINGEVNRSAAYSYYLKPTDIGNYTIPPAYIVAGDQTLETVPLEIIVIPNPDGIVQHPNRPGLRIEDFQLRPSSENKDSTISTRPRKRF